MVPSILKKGYSACKVDGLKEHPKILNLLSLISQCGQMKSGPRKQSIPELPTGGPGQDRIWRQAPWSAEQQDNKCHQAPTAPHCHITWSSPSEARCRMHHHPSESSWRHWCSRCPKSIVFIPVCTATSSNWQGSCSRKQSQIFIFTSYGLPPCLRNWYVLLVAAKLDVWP